MVSTKANAVKKGQPFLIIFRFLSDSFCLHRLLGADGISTVTTHSSSYFVNESFFHWYPFSYLVRLCSKSVIVVLSCLKHRVRPCPKRRLRLQLRLDQRVYQCWRIADARDLAVAVAEVAVSDTALYITLCAESWNSALLCINLRAEKKIIRSLGLEIKATT